MKRNFTTFENIKTNVSLKPCQVFDGFTFWNFGQMFEAIFYQKKVLHQVFGDGFILYGIYLRLLVEFWKHFFYEKKVAHRVFDNGFILFCIYLWLLIKFWKHFFYEKKVVHPVFDDGFTFWTWNSLVMKETSQKYKQQCFWRSHHRQPNFTSWTIMN